MICLCCGTTNNDNQENCAYCGMPVVYVLDDDTHALQAAANWRERRLSQLTKIAIIVHAYKHEGHKFSEAGERVLVFGGGTDCYEKTIWLEQGFAHDPTGRRSQILTLCYDNKSGSQKLTYEMNMPEYHDFYQVGVRIDQNLKLHVLIGDGREALADSGSLELVIR